MQEKAGVKERVQKNEHAYSVGGVFIVSDSTAHPCLKQAGLTALTQTNQSSCKLL